MPQKKKKPSAPPPPLPTKASFFLPKREYSDDKPAVAESAPVAVRPRFQRLLYDRETGMPYAEVINNVAMCLFSGEELFRFQSAVKDDEDHHTQAFSNGFDFTPPKGKRHPDDRSVDVKGLVDAGIMSNDDVALRKAFSDEELSSMMKRLEEYHAEREAMCAFRME